MNSDKINNLLKGTKYPHESRCKACGKPYMKTWPTHKFCKECATKRAKAQALESQRRRYTKIKEQREARKKAEQIREHVMKGDIPEHVCVMGSTCIYGYRNGDMACNYAYIKGQMRTKDGKHKIVNGMCDLYERDPDKKPKRRNLTL